MRELARAFAFHVAAFFVLAGVGVMLGSGVLVLFALLVGIGLCGLMPVMGGFAAFTLGFVPLLPLGELR